MPPPFAPTTHEDEDGENEYQVLSGENPVGIAQKFGIPLNKLLEVNQDKLHGPAGNQFFYAREKIIIPGINVKNHLRKEGFSQNPRANALKGKAETALTASGSKNQLSTVENPPNEPENGGNATKGALKGAKAAREGKIMAELNKGATNPQDFNADFPAAIESDPEKAALISKEEREKLTAFILETPETNQDYATWVLKMADEAGFVLFNGGNARKNWEKIRDGEEIALVKDPANDPVIPSLPTIFKVVQKRINRYLNAGGEKSTVTLGSFMLGRDKKPHTDGGAIDINGLDFENDPKSVLQWLRDLPDGNFGVGLPAQGEFFKSDQDIQKKKKIAENLESPGTVEGWYWGFSDLYTSTYGWTELKGNKWKLAQAFTGKENEEEKKELEKKYTLGWTTNEKKVPVQKSALVYFVNPALAAEILKEVSYIFPDNDNHIHVHTL
ncbi:MAG: hypothetical protein H6581_06205 [Bacteroidia bacterium]|nr:hypothetical protein [Bacteroidia bacterium]